MTAGDALRVLLVEDSREDALAARRALLGSGVAVSLTRCSSGDEALAYLRTCATPPEVALIDLGLPGMDGRTLIRHIRALPDAARSALPIVVFSASDDRRDVRACYQEGANSYLVKPADTAGFVTVLAVFAQHWGRALKSARPWRPS
jgi:CheY-like chemotaxis protein